ncbi:MAG: c-type cytochrome domain-containing protein [Pirellulaceae bacterium]
MQRRVIAMLLGLVLIVTPASSIAAVTGEQRTKLKALAEKTNEAAAFYKTGEYLKCVEQVSEVHDGLVVLLSKPEQASDPAPDPALLRLAKPIYQRLQRARSLLELEGAELKPLPTWKSLSNGAVADEARAMDDKGTAEVSFAKDIAPWIVEACGRCHIDSSRGRFSLATFAALRSGVRGAPVVYSGDTKGSRLVEVIESGDMPRGNRKVSSDQLYLLKKWVEQGANFDGEDPGQGLRDLAGASAPASDAAPQQPPMTRRPDGTESVSFSKDIAPVLLENCNGCHISGRRASGNLRMDSFAQLMRGGDSGEPLAGTNANESLLIRKLRGQEGQRMPAGGRPALPEEQIQLISTWIREGAAFDGDSDRTELELLIDKNWAAEASHAELLERRTVLANAAWSKVSPNDPPATSLGDQVVVLGNVPNASVEQRRDALEKAIQWVRKQLRVPGKEPLIRGGIAAFVLKNRYDYSEFGRMIEGRELPRNWNSHWNARSLDLYGVFLELEEPEEKQKEAIAVQVVAGAYVGSFSKVPFWFAEGVARNLVVSNFRRADPRVNQWLASVPAAMQKIESPKTLLENRLDEEAAGVAGMALTQFMMNKTNRRRFDKMLELLREGRPFDEAMTMTFASPEVVVASWLGRK